ncbi:MAG TPA: hypothetical protein VGR12_06850 [Solirubrobacteraceae bacterium]|nr:hypothetical protein [Solirubrobacteraceae bacterium]
MDTDYWIIGLVIVFGIAVAWSLYGSRRQTGISSHPVEEQSGAPAAGEERGRRQESND